MKKWLFILLISFFVFIPKDVFANSVPYTGTLSVNLARAYSGTSWVDTSNGGSISLGSNTFYRLSFYFKGNNYCQNPTSSATFTGYIKTYDVGYLGQSSSLNISGAVLKDGGNNVKGLCRTTSINCSPGNVATTYSGDTNIKPFSTGTTCSFQVTCDLENYNNSGISCVDYGNVLDFSIGFNGSSSSSFSPYLDDEWYNTRLPNEDLITAIDNLKSAQSEITNKIDETNKKLDDLNDNITDSNISGASDSAGGFFTDFEDDDYGLSDIVTLPLTFIQGLANAECTELSLPLPFVDENVELPCMSDIYVEYAGPFLTIYQIITFGIVGYWVCVNTLRLVNNFKNPDNDEVEVMDL